MAHTNLSDAIFWKRINQTELEGSMELQGKTYACRVRHLASNRIAAAQAQQLITAKFKLFLEEYAKDLPMETVAEKPLRKKPGPKPKAKPAAKKEPANGD